ncbi:hypothetical protein [Telluribacter sp.]|uniref:hypothetical protein n=1 Tax=Telluribacter sp. TaxID=1978767 RepID=UPI002E10D1E2|nr:hypothetical protein [Telluribacter sp.]
MASFRYRWTNAIEGFDMPVKVALNGGERQFIQPTTSWKTMKTKGVKSLAVDRNFYVGAKGV